MAPPDAPAPMTTTMSTTACAASAGSAAGNPGSEQPIWQSVVLSDGALIAECTVPSDLRCLRGHFPGAPVVPGIAFVGWVLDLLRTHRDLDQPVRRLSRLRFRQPVLPGMSVTLTVRNVPDGLPAAGSVLRFTLQREDTLCASGQIDL